MQLLDLGGKFVGTRNRDDLTRRFDPSGNHRVGFDDGAKLIGHALTQRSAGMPRSKQADWAVELQRGIAGLGHGRNIGCAG